MRGIETQTFAYTVVRRQGILDYNLNLGACMKIHGTNILNRNW